MYIRKWIPELRHLSDKDNMEHDQASEDSLKEAGIILGETYPSPVVTHKAGHTRALLAYEEIKKG